MHCLAVTRGPAPRDANASFMTAPANLCFRGPGAFGLIMRHSTVNIQDTQAFEDVLNKVACSWAGCVLMQASARPVPPVDSPLWRDIAPPPAPGTTGILSSLQATSSVARAIFRPPRPLVVPGPSRLATEKQTLPSVYDEGFSFELADPVPTPAPPVGPKPLNEITSAVGTEKTPAAETAVAAQSHGSLSAQGSGEDLWAENRDLKSACADVQRQLQALTAQMDEMQAVGDALREDKLVFQQVLECVEHDHESLVLSLQSENDCLQLQRDQPLRLPTQALRVSPRKRACCASKKHPPA